MNSFKVAINLCFALLCSVIVQSKSFAEPQNIGELKKILKVYHDSGAYDKEIQQVIASAKHDIIKQVRMNQLQKNPKKLAIVLDIDETSISNYEHILTLDFGFNKQKWEDNMTLANAPAIKPMLSLYKTALNNHIAVFFVTGRSVHLKDATIKNLKTSGYTTWDGIYFRPNDYKQKSISLFKTQSRADITKKGYTIIASIGDQASDFEGGYSEHNYKLPNPFYQIH